MKNQFAKTTIKVAIVEDQTLLSSTLATQLAHHDCIQVLFIASDGQHMQNQISKYGVPEVIVMDIKMPNMNGYRTTVWIRKHHPDVSVLALSGLASPEVIQEIHQCGALGFVSKDQPLEDLIHAIQHVAKREKYVNPWLENGSTRVSRYHFRQRFIDLLNPDRMRILTLLAMGLSNAEIADNVATSVATVKKHLEVLFEHFGARNRLELVKKAIDMGLLTNPLIDSDDEFNVR